MRRPELNYAPGVLCLAVCLIHVLSVAVTELDVHSWQFALVFWPWRVCSCAVPAFLLLGGLKVGLHPPAGYLGYLKRRARRVALTYLIAFAVYFVVYCLLDYQKPTLEVLVQKLFWGKQSYHFYYVILVLQFYLLLPLWRLLLKRIPVWAALVGALLITFLWRGVPTLLDRAGIDFPYNDRVVPTYLVFWVFGLYAGKDYDRFREVLRRGSTLRWTGFMALLSAGVGYYGQYSRVSVPNSGLIQAMGDVSACLCLLGLCLRLEERGPGILRRVLDWLGRGSYQIYLWHALFLTLLVYFLPPMPIENQLVLRGVVTLGGGIGVWALVDCVTRRIKRRKVPLQ